MKTNRKVMLGAALVVAIVALAGVGYATFTGPFKSVTVNDGNTVSPGYIRADQQNYTAMFTKDLELDTYTSSTEKVYVLKNSTFEVATDVHGELLGEKQITINAVGITPASYKITAVSLSGTTNLGAWSYYLSVDGGNTFVDVSSINDTTGAVTIANTTFTVQLYIAGPDFGNARGVDGWADLGCLVSNTPVAAAASISAVFTVTATI